MHFCTLDHQSIVHNVTSQRPESDRSVECDYVTCVPQDVEPGENLLGQP
jgi:hypothetical protein